MRLVSLFPIVLTVLFFSCSSQKHAPNNYIENMPDTVGKDVVKNIELIIQKNDLLSIQVYSNSIKPEVSDAIYNPAVLNATTGINGSVGYLVDVQGNIKFPRIGTFHAEGLTKR